MRENVRVIYNGSTDPVIIKKIPLKIWRLRDEISAVIKKRIESGAISSDDKKAIADLVEEYQYKGPPPKVNENVDNKRDGLKLIEGGESKDENNHEALGENENINEEDSQEKDKGKDKTAPATIKQRRPKILEEKIHRGTLIISELEMDHLYFFTNHQFVAGQSIVIEFVLPKTFTVNADISFCRAFNNKSRIISKKRLPYRVGATFTFLKEGERTLLRNFVKSIEPDVPKITPKILEKNKQNEEDDDFDDLDL